jgi:hypothetical protein
MGTSDYAKNLEEQAAAHAARSPVTIDVVRQLLILSAAAPCKTAQHFFETRLNEPTILDFILDTIEDADGFFSGDARIQAAFYLGQIDPVLLLGRSGRLLSLYDAEDGEGAGGCLRALIALALARAKVRGGRERILADRDPGRFDNAHFERALGLYGEGA